MKGFHVIFFFKSHIISALAVLCFLTLIPLIAAGQETPLDIYIKSISLTSDASNLFVLYENGEVAVYNIGNARQPKFITQKRATEPQNPDAATISQNGDFYVLFDTDTKLTRIAVYKVEAFLNNAEDREIRPFVLYTVAGGQVWDAFSTDGSKLYVSSSLSDTVSILDLNSQQQKIIPVGKSPSRLVIAQENDELYVLNSGSNDVSVIDLKQEVVIRRIPVGKQPNAFLYQPASRRLFVVNTNANSVSVIDTTTKKLVKEIRVGSVPFYITQRQRDNSVFVANNGDGTISAISSDLQIHTIPTASSAYFPSAPISLFYSQEIDKLLIVNLTTREISVVDPSTRSELVNGKIEGVLHRLLGSRNEKSDSVVFILSNDGDGIQIFDMKTGSSSYIPEGKDEKKRQRFFSTPQAIVVDEGDNRIFVTNLGSGTITVIDGATQKPLSLIQVGPAPQTLAYNTKTKKLYVADVVDNTVRVIDTTITPYVAKAIEVGGMPRTLTINERTNRVYVSLSEAEIVGVIDGVSDKLLTKINLGKNSVFPLVSTDDEERNIIYVANYGGDTVSVINGETNKVIKDIKVGSRPIFIRFFPELRRIYVTVEGEQKIVIIDPERQEVVDSLQIAGVPYRIFRDRETNFVYISHRREDIVTVIRSSPGDLKNNQIIQETRMPFWGETDTIYKIVGFNMNMELGYFVQAQRHQIVIAKIFRNPDGGIMSFGWFGTINQDGNFTSSETPKEEKERVTTFRDYFKNRELFIGIVIFIILLAIIVIVWYRKKVNTQQI